MSLLGELVVKVIGDISGLNKSMDLADKRVSNFQKKMKGVGTSMSQVGRGLTMGVTLPALALGGAILKTGADFDSAMTESLAIMQDVSPEIRNQMEETARTIATTTNKSATEAAESYFFLASAGLDAAQSIEALPKVAQFAQAGNFDMALATDLLTDAQSALGMTIRDDVVANMENMVRVSDVLVKANTLANATVQQFSESLTNDAAAAIRLVNKDIEEGVAVLAVFADQGLKGAAAGSSLAIVFRDLQKAALENKDIFDEMGVSVFDADGNMRNMADIVDDLSGLLDGMSDEQKKATLMMLGFQERSVKNIQLLLDTGDAMRGYEEGLRSAGGVTQEIADNQMESMSAQLGLLKAKAIELGLAFFKKLEPVLMNDVIPALGDLLESLAPVLETLAEIMPGLIETLMPQLQEFIESIGSGAEKFADLDPKMQAFITKLAGIAIAAGPALMILGPLVRVVSSLIGPLGKLGGLFGKGLAGGAGTGAAALSSFTLVGAALAAILIAQKKLANYSDTLENKWAKLTARGASGYFGFARTIEESLPIFQAVVDKQVSIGTALTMTRDEMLRFNETGEAQNTMWQNLISIVDEWENRTLAMIRNWGINIKNFFANLWKNVISLTINFKNSFIEEWNILKSKLSSITNSIKGIIDSIKTKIESLINSIINSINRLASRLNFGGINLPSFNLPHFADGGISEGGLAVVGERGREIVDLPKGARVTPLNQVGNSTIENTFIIEQLIVREEADVDKIAEALKDKQDIKTRGLGVSII